jgi:hypothetical protein
MAGVRFREELDHFLGHHALSQSVVHPVLSPLIQKAIYTWAKLPQREANHFYLLPGVRM